MADNCPCSNIYVTCDPNKSFHKLVGKIVGKTHESCIFGKKKIRNPQYLQGIADLSGG